MFFNRLKIALRLMVRQRFFSILNLIGLATGAGCFLLIHVYVMDELSYDQFHANKEHLYRINMTNIWIENNDVFGSTGPGVAKAVLTDIPEVKAAVRIHHPYLVTKLVQVRDELNNIKSFEEEGILAADGSFFEIFSFPFLSGDPASALEEPNSVVISRDYAFKYFGEQPALGKTISVGAGDQQQFLKVTGVFENVPDQSHFDFDMLISMKSFPKVIRRSDVWIWTGFVTYITLNPGANMELVRSKLSTLPAKYVGEEEATRKNWKLYLQNIADIHLYSGNVPNRLGSIGSIDNVIMFGTVAILIILLSCVNFMNLSTAQYANRAREVGIQKILGSRNSHIRAQFFTESLLYSFFAVILGFGLAELMKGWFNTISGKNLSINLFENPVTALLMLVLIVVIGLLSGSYPSWFLTRFKALDVLRGTGGKGRKSAFRNGLVIFQLTISMALLGSSFLVKDQLSFLQNKSLGFSEENVLVIPHMDWMQDDGVLYKDKVSEINGVLSASLSNQVPPRIWYQENITPIGSDKTDDLPVSTMIVDPEFIRTLDLELVAGRNFFESGESDKRSVMINEMAAIQMGWLQPGDDPDIVVGKHLGLYEPGHQFRIIGVLRDFNFFSLELPVEPLALFHPQAPMWQGDQRFLMVKLQTTSMHDLERALADLKSNWADINPTLPFDSHFLTQEFDAAFEDQRKFGSVLDTFTGVAILIAILGLIGLISFSAEQRTKEFSIRKVLGATIPHLVGIVTLDFTKMLIFGFILGSGLSFYYGRRWLDNFAYRTEVSPTIFILSGAILLLIIVTISVIIIQKNARKNPALTLRND